MDFVKVRAYPRHLTYHYMALICSTSLPICRTSGRLSALPMHLVVASALVTTIILELLGIFGAVWVVLIAITVPLIVHVVGVFFGLMVSSLFVVGVHTY